MSVKYLKNGGFCDMISIVKRKINMTDELRSKIKWACTFNNCVPKIKDGSLKLIEHTNLAYVGPNRVIIKEKLFFFEKGENKKKKKKKMKKKKKKKKKRPQRRRKRHTEKKRQKTKNTKPPPKKTKSVQKIHKNKMQKISCPPAEEHDTFCISIIKAISSCHLPYGAACTRMLGASAPQGRLPAARLILL